MSAARRRLRAAAAAALFGLAFGAAGPLRGQAPALAGTDRVRLELPASGLVEPYANAGYRLAVDGGTARVEVSLAPLRSAQRFAPPAAADDGSAVAQLARALTAGAGTRYAASSRILDWVARHVAYELDRTAPQSAAAVLARRRGYCTGIARLAVALLQAAGIPAREVAGFVVAPPGGGVPAGFHRWVEVGYDDVGWVFSDPLLSHHYVPATYVRLASEALLPAPEPNPGRLLWRDDSRQPVDLFDELPAGVTVRRNEGRQRAAALRVTLPGASAGTALLEGEGVRRTRPLVDGAGSFLGLSPGTYLLRVEVEGRPPLRKRITLRDRVVASVHLQWPRTDPLSTAAPHPVSAGKEDSRGP